MAALLVVDQSSHGDFGWTAARDVNPQSQKATQVTRRRLAFDDSPEVPAGPEGGAEQQACEHEVVVGGKEGKEVSSPDTAGYSNQQTEVTRSPPNTPHRDAGLVPRARRWERARQQPRVPVALTEAARSRLSGGVLPAGPGATSRLRARRGSWCMQVYVTGDGTATQGLAAFPPEPTPP